jgi:hypothetical protein
MPKNLVGATVPSAEQQQQYLSQAKALTSSCRTFGVNLSSEERTTYPKLRIGGEKLLDPLVALAEAYGVNLPAMPLAQMKADISVARTSEGLEREIAVSHELVSDTRLAAYGEAWQAFLAYYSVLSSMAERDPGLASQLAPFSDFMARRRPQPKNENKVEE